MENEIERLIKEKQTGLGSSDAAAIMGLSRFKTALHVQTEKLEKISVQEETEAMTMGLIFEPVILQLYAMRTGIKARKVHQVQRSKIHNFMLAHLDAKAGAKPIEAKLSLNPRGEFGEEGTDEIPAEYIIQTQHQMAVTGALEVDVPVLLYGRLKIYCVKRNQRLIKQITEQECEFWKHHIERQEPVAPDFNHPATPDLIKNLYAINNGKTIDLGSDAEEIAALYKQIGKQKSEADKAQKELKAKLLYAMGDAEAALTPNGVILTRKEIHVDAHNVDAYDYVNLYIKQSKELKVS